MQFDVFQKYQRVSLNSWLLKQLDHCVEISHSAKNDDSHRTLFTCAFPRDEPNRRDHRDGRRGRNTAFLVGVSREDKTRASIERLIVDGVEMMDVC